MVNNDQKPHKLQSLLHFIKETEGLKKLMRHSWLSNGRRESVAEHTWRMSIMAMVLASELEAIVDMERVLKMIMVHDLGEIYAGDRVAWKKQKIDKHKAEKEGLRRLIKTLPKLTQKTIISLWKEFEENKTNEARFAQALDKLEVLIQHNQANLKTWRKAERGNFSLYYGDELCAHDRTLKTFKDLVREESRKKLEKT